jgi:hypothetical protein
MKKIKSSKQLDSFFIYCIEHPNLRFWQALLAWSGYSFIYGSVEPDLGNLPDVNSLEDTFYKE